MKLTLVYFYQTIYSYKLVTKAQESRYTAKLVIILKVGIFECIIMIITEFQKISIKVSIWILLVVLEDLKQLQLLHQTHLSAFSVIMEKLTWILCKDSRKGSRQSHVGSNFIVLFFLKSKSEHLRLNFMNLVPGVFEIRYILFM